MSTMTLEEFGQRIEALGNGFMADATDMLRLICWVSLVPPLPLLALSYLFEGPQAIERAVLVAKGSDIGVADLPETIRQTGEAAVDFVIPPHRTLAEIEKAAIVQTLQRETAKALATPALKERLASQGAVASGMSSKDFAALIASETKKWSQVVKSSGAKLD